MPGVAKAGSAHGKVHMHNGHITCACSMQMYIAILVIRIMLYGSDWMMVSRLENRRSFVRDFNKVFDLNNLGEHREAFFGGNAIRLLELDKD